LTCLILGLGAVLLLARPADVALFTQPVQYSQIKPALRSSTPTMVMVPDPVSASVVLPATLIADSGGLLFASGSLFFALLIFAVVAIIVVNFGIMKR
jgi:hypothetical protein